MEKFLARSVLENYFQESKCLGNNFSFVVMCHQIQNWTIVAVHICCFISTLFGEEETNLYHRHLPLDAHCMFIDTIISFPHGSWD